MRFLIVCVGRDGTRWVEPCLRSIASQRGQEYRVCVIDDASLDPEQPRLIRRFAREHGWDHVLNASPWGAMANQVTAWRRLEPTDDDVIVFVDLDDRLAHPDVLNVVAEHYAAGALMTYGSYVPEPSTDPSAKTCPPAQPYPAQIVARAAYRRHPVCYNHLRTVSWRVLKHLREADLRDRRGRYWRTSPDAAVMLPCLELAGGRHHFIEEVLYVYTCDNPASEWRAKQELARQDHKDLRSRQPRRALVLS